MNTDEPPRSPEFFDDAAYHTPGLADPDLAASYAVENEGIRLDGQAMMWATLFALPPLGLVLLLLSAALGDWAWDLLLPIWVALIVGTVLVRSGLIRRYLSELPIHLPRHGVFHGPAKRRLLRNAIAVVVVLTLLEIANEAGWLGRVTDWVAGWIVRVL